MLKRNCVVLLFLLTFLSACKSNRYINGYVEDSVVNLSVPVNSTLVSHLDEGQVFKKGDQLAKLSATNLELEIKSKKSLIASLKSDLQNSEEGLRAEKIRILEAKKNMAKADLVFADSDLQRLVKLKKGDYTTQFSLDQAKRAKTHATESLKMSEFNISLGKKGARESIIKSLKLKIEASELELKAAKWAYNQLLISAPFDGQIQTVYFENHERVSPNQPVIAITAPLNQQVIFFLEEGDLAKIKPGNKVGVITPFSNQKLKAKVLSISDKPEFTPPILFDQQARSPYSYRVKARLIFNKNDQLHAGQPVSIQLLNS